MDIRGLSLFKDCEFKIESMSKASFVEKSHLMSEEKRTIAEKRLANELEIILKNGFSCEYILNKAVVDYAQSVNRVVCIGGQAPYSYVAFLLGITTVDPLERKYPLELAFGYYHDRVPGFFLRVPEVFEDELTAYLDDVFGADKVTRKENTIILGDKTEDTVYLSQNALFMYIFSTKIMNDVQEALSRSEASFKEQSEAIFAPIYPSGALDSSVELQKISGLIGASNSEDLAGTDYDSLLDGTYEGLLRALAVTGGTGVLEADLRDDDGHLICTRDDFYRFGRSLLDSDKNAFKFMSQVRKGQARYDEYRDCFVNMGVPDDIIDKLKSIKYVVNEGSLIPAAQIILYLASR